MMKSFLNSNLFIDFHTHVYSKEDNVVKIYSNHFSEPIGKEFFTIGQHPWFAKSILNSEEIKKFTEIVKKENCLGIGEIGLDKLRGETINIQMLIFKQMLNIAEDLNKPVIIHCVKAFDKIIATKKEHPNVKNWAIHGFYGSPELAKQLIKLGFYISLNSKFTETAKFKTLVETIPLDKLFIETDANENTKIEILYLQIARIKKIDLEKLKKQISKNAIIFFKNE